MASWLRSAWNFSTRHKKKLAVVAVVGAVVGTATYMTLNVRRKLKEVESLLQGLSPSVDQDQLYVMRMQVHLETCMTSAQHSVRSHLDQIQRKLNSLFNTDEITAQLKQKPNKTKKRELWEDLKVKGFCQLISAAYCVCLLHAMVHLQLTLLTRLALNQSANCEVSEETKLSFLMDLGHLHEGGAELIGECVANAVRNAIAPVSLNASATPNDFLPLLKTVTAMLSSNTGHDINDGSFQIDIPRCLYSSTGDIKDLPADQAVTLNNLRQEMRDIIAGPAFARVVEELLEQTLHYVVCNTFQCQLNDAPSEAADGACQTTTQEPSSRPLPQKPSEQDQSQSKAAASDGLPRKVQDEASRLNESMLSSVSTDMALQPAPSGPAILTMAKVTLRVPQVVRVMLLRDGELVWCLGDNAALKHLCSIVLATGDQGRES
eukprot:c41021_g1_i1.p1 GENE.c41021_g1_i1~~c41021_g1_i1.p1  ORF type:complete len:433 (-),score=86.50 c41021_g1_i1:44-1342(-)